jgi:serine/threonine-protein kinase
MSPEQAAGNPVDARADVYALGCMLYEMFTGRPPFTGRTFVAVLMAQLAEAPVPPRACDPPAGIPAPLESLILKALAKEADHRQPSMRALEAELAEVDLDAAAAPASGAPPDTGPLVLAQVEPGEGPTEVYDGRGPWTQERARTRSAAGSHPVVATPPPARHTTRPLPLGAAEPPRRTTNPLPLAIAQPARRTTDPLPLAAAEPRRNITGSRPPAAAPARRTTNPLPLAAAEPRRSITGSRPAAAAPTRHTTGSRPATTAAHGVSPELALIMGQGDADRTVPVPKLPRGPVVRQMAAQPDPLPRLLDEIDPPERRRFGAAGLVVILLLVGAAAAVLVWLLVR